MINRRPHRRAVSLGLAGLGLAGAAEPPPPSPSPPSGIDEGALLATAPDLAGRITVPVRVNGEGPFDFVVDTGANRTVIAGELAAELGLPDDGPASIHGIVGVEPTR